jgi:Tol biopolymer transport system component
MSRVPTTAGERVKIGIGAVLVGLLAPLLALELAGGPTGAAAAPPGLVAYACGANHRLLICTMDAQGHDVQQLTAAHPDDPMVGPTWSPDGKRMVFVCDWSRQSANYTIPVRDLIDFGPVGYARNAGGQLCEANADGSDWAKVSTDSFSVAAPAWSPDGQTLAMTKIDDNLSDGIVLIASNGIGPATTVSSDAEDDFPAWSPDGTRIAFTSGTTLGIVVVNRDGSERHELTTPGNAVDVGPSWSPDGQSIAFTRYNNLKQETWVMDATGNHSRKLTSSPVFDPNIGVDFTPKWSPDGRKLLVTTVALHNKATVAQLSVVDVTGAKAMVVTPSTTRPHASGSFLGAWARDGSTIFFSSDRAGKGFDLYRVAVNGKNVARLTTTSKSDAFDPAVQPG